MGKGDTLNKRKDSSDIPPVPIKTYQWEDLRRAKKRGGYPWTYLTKEPFDPFAENMDDKPVNGDESLNSEAKKKTRPKLKKTAGVDEPVKKKKIVKKVVKKSTSTDSSEKPAEEATSSEKPTPEEDKKTEQISKVSESENKLIKRTNEEEAIPEDEWLGGNSEDTVPSHSTKKSEDVPIPEDEWLGSRTETPTVSIKLKPLKTYHDDESTDDWLSSFDEKSPEDKEVETILRSEEKSKETPSIKAATPVIEVVSNIDDDVEKENEILPVEEEKTSQKALSIAAESDDTSNAEQYLDKEELSKASTTDVSMLQDKPSETLTVPGTSAEFDKQRKPSSGSEITKSTLSLFRKMKNSKFKMPTLKVTKFKKLGLSKKSRVIDSKHGSLKRDEETTSVPLRRRVPESPVYIHIPLNPSPEQLAKEKEEAVKKTQQILEKRKLLTPPEKRKPQPEAPQKKEHKLTFDTLTKKLHKGKKSPTSKKKSPPRKSPSPPKRTSPLSAKKRDSPVEYIYIPLHAPEDEQKQAEEAAKELFEMPPLTRKYLQHQEKIKENKIVTVGKPMKATFKKKIIIKPIADLKGEKTPSPKVSPVKRAHSFKEDVEIALKEIEVPKKVEEPEPEPEPEPVVETPVVETPPTPVEEPSQKKEEAKAEVPEVEEETNPKKKPTLTHQKSFKEKVTDTGKKIKSVFSSTKMDKSKEKEVKDEKGTKESEKVETKSDTKPKETKTKPDEVKPPPEVKSEKPEDKPDRPSQPEEVEEPPAESEPEQDDSEKDISKDEETDEPSKTEELPPTPKKPKKERKKKNKFNAENKIKVKTQQISDDLTKLASKLKSKQAKEAHKPTSKILRKSQHPSFKSISSKSSIRSRSRSRSRSTRISICDSDKENEDEATEERPEGPVDVNKALEEASKKLQKIIQTPTEDEKVSDRQIEDVNFDEVWNGMENEEAEENKENVNKSTKKSKRSHSPFDSLKRTKELGKKSIQKIKEVMTPRDKSPHPKSKEKMASTETENKTNTEISSTQPTKIADLAPKVEEKEPKKEPTLPQKVEETTHHYEPVSKEDEEDGLKSAVIQQKIVAKVVEKTELPKSNLKGKDSPKLEKKVSFRIKTQSQDSENGLKGLETEKEKTSGEEDKLATPVIDDKWLNIGDHEYEPINPPPETQTKVQSETGEQKRTQESFNGDKFLRIPLDNELIMASSEENIPKKQQQQQQSSQKSETKSIPSSSTSETQKAKISGTGYVDTNIEVEEEIEDEAKGPTMQQKMRNQATLIKNKFKGMKRPQFAAKMKKPNIQRPKFTIPKINRPKFERPKIDTSKMKMPAMKMPPMPKMQMPQMPKMQMPNMPKMPTMPKINMPSMSNRSQLSFPSFSLPRTKRQSQEQRTFSTTESSVGSKPNIFDFRTYPRIFDKSRKTKLQEATEDITSSGTDNPTLEVATAPKRKKGPVGARWVKKFADIDYADAELKPEAITAVDSVGRPGSVERQLEAELRFQQALALQEGEDEMREYEKETQDIHRQSTHYTDRWSHGSFHQANTPGDFPEPNIEVDLSKKDEYNQSERSSIGSGSPGNRRRRGVLEEIDSDEFFLRQKGISQDNIQYGLYLSSEIRDAFRQPVNALSQMSDAPQSYGSRDYGMDDSDLSLSKPRRPRRKHLKKTKKIKKTPHTSHEKILFYQESLSFEGEEETPTIPKRGKKPKTPEVEEYQEELEEEKELPKSKAPIARYESDNLSLPNIVGYVDRDINKEYERFLKDEVQMYENEMMKDKDQPEIVVSNQDGSFTQKDIDAFLRENGFTDIPKPPTRRNRSLRSLDRSEQDSIIEEFHKDATIILHDRPMQEISVYRVEQEVITATLEEIPVAPKRLRSRSRTAERDGSQIKDEPLVSEIDTDTSGMRDEFGYAIVDKNRNKDKPPRPAAPRRSRSRSLRSSKKSLNSETKFFTTPRPLNDSKPARPTRNYSTLGSPSRPPRRKSPSTQVTEENKENVDLGQYIEIEDDLEDHSRLQSGEVINKMKARPLPAPPRPPRKQRDFSKEPLQDITLDGNVVDDYDQYEKDTEIPIASDTEVVEEFEVSTQTDPLPDDFVCEEVLQEPTDKIVAPSRRRRSTLDSISDTGSRTAERVKTPSARSISPNVMIIEKRVQTPTVDFDVDGTITHASIVVKPVAEYPPDSYVSQRFSADLPDIMPNILSSPIYTDEDLIQKEEESLRKQEIPHDESCPPQESPVPDEPERDLEEKSDHIESETKSPEESEESEFERYKRESTEDDLIPPESFVIEEQPPPIPEKPLRMKLKQESRQSLEQSMPTSPVQEQMPQQPLYPIPHVIERIIERPVPISVAPGPDTEVEVLKAAKLQVTDLDVERLTVGELQASKILVSEIDGVNLQISEICSKTGTITVNGLEIPTGLIQEILEKLQPAPAQTTVVEQVSTQTDAKEKEEAKEEVVSEQASTQTEVSIDTETEQVSTQTSFDLSEVVEKEQAHTQTDTQEQPLTEQASTQTSPRPTPPKEIEPVESEVLDTKGSPIDIIPSELQTLVDLPQETKTDDPIVEQPTEPLAPKEQLEPAIPQQAPGQIALETSEILTSETEMEQPEVKSEVESTLEKTIQDLDDLMVTKPEEPQDLTQLTEQTEIEPTEEEPEVLDEDSFKEQLLETRQQIENLLMALETDPNQAEEVDPSEEPMVVHEESQSKEQIPSDFDQNTVEITETSELMGLPSEAVPQQEEPLVLVEPPMETTSKPLPYKSEQQVVKTTETTMGLPTEEILQKEELLVSVESTPVQEPIVSVESTQAVEPMISLNETMQSESLPSEPEQKMVDTTENRAESTETAGPISGEISQREGPIVSVKTMVTEQPMVDSSETMSPELLESTGGSSEVVPQAEEPLVEVTPMVGPMVTVPSSSELDKRSDITETKTDAISEVLEAIGDPLVSEETVSKKSEIPSEASSSVSEHIQPQKPEHHDTQKIIKLTSEPIDISESPLSFDNQLETSESTSEAKKKLEIDSEYNEKNLVKEVIDDLLSGQISDLQKRIATLQEQMTIESTIMLDSEDENIADEPLSEFDESLIPELIDDSVDIESLKLSESSDRDYRKYVGDENQSIFSDQAKSETKLETKTTSPRKNSLDKNAEQPETSSTPSETSSQKSHCIPLGSPSKETPKVAPSTGTDKPVPPQLSDLSPAKFLLGTSDSRITPKASEDVPKLESTSETSPQSPVSKVSLNAENLSETPKASTSTESSVQKSEPLQPVPEDKSNLEKPAERKPEGEALKTSTSTESESSPSSSQKSEPLQSIAEGKVGLEKPADKKPEISRKVPEGSKMQRTLSQPVAPSEMPNLSMLGSLAQSHVLQGLPHPVSQTTIPTFVYVPQPHDEISEEDIPVHHKRRRAPRRLSRSSSEEDEEPRPVPRHFRHTRSPEPTVPQLTVQLIRTSATSLDRTLSELCNYVVTHIPGTPEGKQNLQVALIIILIFFAALILLGFGRTPTIHHHHWEYFNPPTDF